MCKVQRKIKNLYSEKKYNGILEASCIEAILFYFSILCALIFLIINMFSNNGNFRVKSFVLFIPTIYWVFLRSSRKDMRATSYLIAGIFGAIGGAITYIIVKIFEHYF